MVRILYIMADIESTPTLIQDKYVKMSRSIERPILKRTPRYNRPSYKISKQPCTERKNQDYPN